MMTALTKFKFKHEEFGNIRVVLIDGVPWLVGKDVAKALGYERANKAVVDHVDEDYRKMVDGKTQSQIGINLGQRGGWLINEAGMYQLIFGSKLPAAKEFTRWVTSEVLPSIRATGSYSISDEEQKRLEARENGKKAGRRPFTDAIQIFAERDKTMKPGLYYALPTRFIQTDLCGIPNGGRDNASIDQLLLLTFLESAGANVLQKAAEQGKSFRDALYDMSQTTFFLKRVYQGDVPQIGKGGTQ